MAEAPTSSWSPPPSGCISASCDDARTHWCYHCNSYVSVEAPSPGLPDVVCSDCKDGFVAKPSSSSPHSAVAEAPTSPPLLPLDDNDENDDDDDFLRIEFDGWGNEADEGDEEYEAEYFDEGERGQGRDRHRPQWAGDLFGLRLREFVSRVGASRRSPLLDWAEIIRGLEDHIIELRVEMPDESEGYFGNPEDYVDAAGYEVLLQNLVENDGGAGRGAPPAARSAVRGLPTVVIEGNDGLMCAICKEKMDVGEEGKKLPCDHVYHGDCITPWLESRNSCPVCRFELPTDDVDYEQGRKRRPDFTRNDAI